MSLLTTPYSIRRALETTPFSHSFPFSHNGTVSRNSLPLRQHVHAGTTVTEPLNSIVPSETHHNGTVSRNSLPLRQHVHAGTTVTEPLNSIVPSETHHNGTVSRNSLPLRHHVLHCIQPSHNRHSHLLQSLLSTHLHNLLIIHNLSREPFYRVISYIAYNSLHTAYFSTYTSLHLTPSEGVQFPRVFRPPSEGA